MNFRSSKRELFQMRNERFSRNRRKAESMEMEETEALVENIQDVDYHTFYSDEVRREIDRSLKMDIPSEMPPLDLLTIALYRRAGHSVYECRQLGSKELDPHMTY